MPISAVLFDLDDTLLWDERSVEEAFRYASEAAGDSVDPRELEAAVRREARNLYESYETFPFTKLIGINPFEALWGNFTAGEQLEFRQMEQLAPVYRKESWRRGLAALGVEDEALAETLAAKFAAERRSRPYIYEETLQVLDKLKGKVKLLLLTNGCPALQQEKLDGVPELVPYFDHVVISGSFGKGKPDKSIFTHAMNLLDIAPEEGIMVGDKLTTDILGGLGAGLTTVWINRTGKASDPEITPDYQIGHLSELLPLVETL
ncbi:HAD family hydrolase [Paenibacillus jilunlii]|uniref:Phosphoserine phosphatase n=1 Tax=Paenibacillus jilunlii TaxID=682956 RepID=A0A1G9K2F4_9BACL|nr:HAD family hydrolase [Paenibacillus jilunlii]KWX70072.1 haloacid dehalogenase [Paenibacillus jilunlii]SDL43908.1 putative hydrolase of the HAD superfamily [Paenibacillus jilunlii]